MRNSKFQLISILGGYGNLFSFFAWGGEAREGFCLCAALSVNLFLSFYLSHGLGGWILIWSCHPPSSSFVDLIFSSRHHSMNGGRKECCCPHFFWSAWGRGGTCHLACKYGERDSPKKSFLSVQRQKRHFPQIMCRFIWGKFNCFG